jgi:hypothetical protein
MPLPKSVVQNSKKGVKFTSNVDRTSYTLEELTRAALRDVGKIITRKAIIKVKKIASGSLKNWNYKFKEFQYWNRKRETDLVIGIKNDTWYGTDQELGMNGQPRREILRSTVFENISLIREIQAKYLKHIEDEVAAQRLIDENAEVAPEDD